ncbi:Uncharacterised protein g2430 [Pycnogonum litorale]
MKRRSSLQLLTDRFPLLKLPELAVTTWWSSITFILSLIWLQLKYLQTANFSSLKNAFETCVWNIKIKIGLTEKCRSELLSWVGGILPSNLDVVTNFTSDWSNGILLCALAEGLSPGTFPRYDLLNPNNDEENIEMGLKEIEAITGAKYLLTPQEVVEYGKESERKMMFLIASTKIRMQKPKIISDSSSTGRPATSSKIDMKDCVAKGMGLMQAVKGRKATFNIYFKSSCDLNIVIEIKGPRNSICTTMITNKSPRAKLQKKTITESLINKQLTGIDYPRCMSLEYELYLKKLSVTFIPLYSGKHNLSIVWRGRHIVGSPYVVRVDESIELETMAKRNKKIPKLLSLHKMASFDMPDDEFEDWQSMPFHNTAMVKRRKVVQRSILINNQEIIMDDVDKICDGKFVADDICMDNDCITLTKYENSDDVRENETFAGKSIDLVTGNNDSGTNETVPTEKTCFETCPSKIIGNRDENLGQSSDGAMHIFLAEKCQENQNVEEDEVMKRISIDRKFLGDEEVTIGQKLPVDHSREPIDLLVGPKNVEAINSVDADVDEPMISDEVVDEIDPTVGVDLAVTLDTSGDDENLNSYYFHDDVETTCQFAKIGGTTAEDVYYQSSVDRNDSFETVINSMTPPFCFKNPVDFHRTDGNAKFAISSEIHATFDADGIADVCEPINPDGRSDEVVYETSPTDDLIGVADNSSGKENLNLDNFHYDVADTTTCQFSQKTDVTLTEEIHRSFVDRISSFETVINSTSPPFCLTNSGDCDLTDVAAKFASSSEIDESMELDAMNGRRRRSSLWLLSCGMYEEMACSKDSTNVTIDTCSQLSSNIGTIDQMIDKEYNELFDIDDCYSVRQSDNSPITEKVSVSVAEDPISESVSYHKEFVRRKGFWEKVSLREEPTSNHACPQLPPGQVSSVKQKMKFWEERLK